MENAAQAISRGLAQAAEIYRRELTEPLVAIYVNLLGDMTPEQIDIGFTRTLAEDRFWPTPAAIRENGLEAARQGPSGADAWDEVVKAIRDEGYLGAPEWSSPEIAHAARILGPWRSFCEGATTESMPAHRARFLAAYDDAVKRGITRVRTEEAAAIAGLVEPAKAFERLARGIGE